MILRICILLRILEIRKRIPLESHRVILIAFLLLSKHALLILLILCRQKLLIILIFTPKQTLYALHFSYSSLKQYLYQIIICVIYALCSKRIKQIQSLHFTHFTFLSQQTKIKLKVFSGLFQKLNPTFKARQPDFSKLESKVII